MPLALLPSITTELGIQLALKYLGTWFTATTMKMSGDKNERLDTKK
jgi:hypothetical protein